MVGVESSSACHLNKLGVVRRGNASVPLTPPMHRARLHSTRFSYRLGPPTLLRQLDERTTYRLRVPWVTDGHQLAPSVRRRPCARSRETYRTEDASFPLFSLSCTQAYPDAMMLITSFSSRLDGFPWRFDVLLPIQSASRNADSARRTWNTVTMATRHLADRSLALRVGTRTQRVWPDPPWWIRCCRRSAHEPRALSEPRRAVLS